VFAHPVKRFLDVGQVDSAVQKKDALSVPSGFTWMTACVKVAMQH
jgi:hypothetical protein